MSEPTSPRPVRVYVNSAPVDVAAGETALDAVRAWDAGIAASVVAGERAIADSRGIVTTPDSPVHSGAIYRIVRSRAGGRAEKGDEA